MAIENKITKTEMFDLLRELVAESDHEQKNEMIEFIDAQVAQIAARAAKAKIRAAEKREESDALCNTIFNTLTTDYQSADDITAAIGDVEVTRAKVIARLKRLIDAASAEKTTAKTDEGKRITVYRLIPSITAKMNADEE